MGRPRPGDKDCHDTPSRCPPPPVPSPASPVRRSVVTALIIIASVLAFLCACICLYIFIRRRRMRLRQALLDAPEVPAPAAVPDDHGGGPEEEEGGGEEVVHHAWHIRTVGLDEAAIQSIALTRYRAGAGMLGAADCSVCLGEFRDGELLRLLPNCGHAFHVPCIDTWLRTHVNCPLCRADVLDTAAAGNSDPPAGANALTIAEQASSNIDESLDHEQPGPGQQQNEQQGLSVQIDQRDHPSSPEPPQRHPGTWVQNFRRIASMDSSLVLGGEASEDEQNSKEKQGNDDDAACCKVSSGSGRSYHKRSLSGGGRWSVASRHCRTRSSMLPL